jgi:LacI family transcriptional regulator
VSEPRPVTIHDVAQAAGVAVSSVSRVLSDHPDVSDAMRLRVNTAAARLGFSPDPIAQSLRRRSSHTVGFVVRDFANAFFGEIIHGIEETLSKAGYTLLVTNSGGDLGREAERIAVLRQRRVDALLLSTISEQSEETKKAISSFDKPVVLLDRDFGQLPVGNVRLDHATGVRDATHHLLRLGHERIAMITGSPDILPTRERLRGFRDAHTAMSVEQYPELEVTGVFSASFARDTTRRLLSLPRTRRPTAVVAGGVQSTIGILQALTEFDLRPGDDLSLAVCDDVPWLRAFKPAISVVSRDPESMGRAAADVALDLIAGKSPHTVSLTTSYEPRETSCPVPGGRPRADAGTPGRGRRLRS